MACVTCGSPNAKNSKYCQHHKELARQTMLAKFAASGKTREDRDAEFKKLWSAADAAGNNAVLDEQHKLVGMVVVQHTNPLDDNSPAEKVWLVRGGPCGYSTVRVTNGTCAFAHWVRKNKLGSKSYYRGINLAAHMRIDGPLIQSYQLNRAYASEFARVLAEAGIPVTVDSRED